MTAIGETLRRERLRRSLGLEQISQELKISPRFLEAIESEQFNRLPGGVFAKSFVRQYARLLGLDEDEMAAEVQRVLEPEPEPASSAPAKPVVTEPYLRLPRMRAWERIGDGKRAWWWSPLLAFLSVVGVMVVCSGIYAWWQARRMPAPSSVQTQAAGAARTRPTPSALPQQPPAAQPTQSAAASLPEAAASADRRAPDFVSPALSTQPPAVSSANLAQNPAGPPGDPNAPVQLQLVADEPVWVRARSGGKFLFSGTLEANQTRSLDSGGMVELLVGNAGGLRIAVNGKQIGTVGPKGQVRTVQLTSGGFRIVPPKPPASAPVDPL